MNMVEELKKYIDELLNKIRYDKNIPIDAYKEIMAASEELLKALTDLQETRQIDEEEIKKLYENANSLFQMIETIKRTKQDAKPSYIDEFIPSISPPPFTMPRTLFDPQGTEQITIDVSGRIYSERAELALALLFPGSITYRYGTPIKVYCGRWFQSGRARLSSLHELDPDPQFELKEAYRTFKVYKPLTLRAFRLPTPYQICMECLSLSDGDENCGHSAPRIRVKRLPSNYPITIKLELSRTEGEKKEVQMPMTLIVPEVTFLPEIEVGVALIGFERTASIRGGYRQIRIIYDPPIGIKIKTTGLSFKVRLNDDFVKTILDSNRILRRDIILQLIANELAYIMSDIDLPSYYHEPLLSAIILAIGLDEVIDEGTVTSRLHDSNFVDKVINALNTEFTFREGARPDALLTQRVVESLQSLTITENNLRIKLYQTILHSLAHVFLLATAITSGSQLDDIDYIVNEDKAEIIIFDAVSGGNGSSKTAFEFLSEEGKFDVETYWQSEEREEIYRPKNFDETAFELLLPCINSIADRVFLFGKVEPSENEVKRKLRELRIKEDTHQMAIRKIIEYGISRLFPIGIGYHAVGYSNDLREAERFKEIANICLHGCPECISIGRKCNQGSFYEKYNISKLALDELLNYNLKKLMVTSLSKDETLRILKEYEVAILTVPYTDKKLYEELLTKLNSFVLQLVGREINGKHIKLSGYWISITSNFEAIIYNYMFRLV
jgi:hypothetical protein